MRSILGHIISAEGCCLNSDNVFPVKKYLEAQTNYIGEVQLLLALIAYFRWYVENFRKIAKLLCNLLKNPDIKVQATPSPTATIWRVTHQAVLEKLAAAITEPPILAFPDFKLPFVLHVNASSEGWRCALYQLQKWVARVIEYDSLKLVGVEERYHSPRLEFLALKWVFCDHFREYLHYD